MAPPDTDDTPSLSPTDDTNGSPACREKEAYPTLWNKFMASPYERVDLTSLPLVLDSLGGGSDSISTGSHVYLAHPPTSSSPPLFPSSDFDQILNSGFPEDSLVVVSHLVDGRDSIASSSSWAGSLLFSSPQSVGQDFAESSNLSASFPYTGISSPVSENHNLQDLATPPALSPGVELPSQPLGPLASQALPPVYSPPPYPSSPPPLGVHNVPAVSAAPPFTQNSLIVELPFRSVVHPVVQAHRRALPPSHSSTSGPTDIWNEYTDGGKISNALSFPMMVTHIPHINQTWTYVFLHSWHAVFHDTHTTFPPSSLVQLANQAVSNAYTRWEQKWPDELLLPAPITIGAIAMTAIREYNAPAPVKPLIHLFNRSFRSIIRLARQAAMNHLMRCTLGALVDSQVVPFLPVPHIDIRPPQSSQGTILPRVYSAGHKTFYESSVQWDARFGCRIWHAFEGERVIWFGNEAVRRFLAMMLSPNEDAPWTLGVRHARRASDVVISWGPVAELSNRSVLVLLAKTLASLSTSINGDVVQSPRQFPINLSDGNRNCDIRRLTQLTFVLLEALNDVAVPYPALQMHEREDARLGLISLKEALGFMV